MDLKTILPILFGVILFAVLIANADINQTIKIMSETNTPLLGIGLVLGAIIFWLKVTKWSVLVNFKKHISTPELAGYFLIGFFFSTLTPGRAGDIVRANYIKNKTGLAYSTTSVILDRIIDIVLLLFIGIIALILASNIFNVNLF